MENNNTQQRFQTFLHSGCLGDIILSLPFIIAKQGGNIYIRNQNPMSATNMNFKGMYRLLKSQPYINDVIEYSQKYGHKDIPISGDNVGRIDPQQKVNYDPSIELDFDLDYFRISPYLNKEHLITSYFTVHQTPPQQLPLPFLLIDKDYKFKNEKLNNNVEIPKGEYNVFQVTQRYRWDYNWKKLINSQIKPNYFIGLKSEYDDFIKTYNIKEDNLIFYGDKVKDMYDMALMINYCHEFFCNPSVGYTLAIGLNKFFNMVLNPGMKYLKTGLPIENILNKE